MLVHRRQASHRRRRRTLWTESISMNCHGSCWFALYVLAAQLEALVRAVAGCVVVVVLRTHLGSVGAAWVMVHLRNTEWRRRSGRKGGERDGRGEG